jgi:hypothetical protein
MTQQKFQEDENECFQADVIFVIDNPLIYFSSKIIVCLNKLQQTNF